MKKLSLIVASLLVLLIAVLAVLHLKGRANLASAPNVSTAIIPIKTDANALARGEHIASAVSGCKDCHGSNLGGSIMPDGPPNTTIIAPNLTRGKGGVGSRLSDQTWIRAIAHGVGGDGRTLIIMPSAYYAHMSADDLGSLVGYLKSVPPVDNELPPTRIDFPSSVIFGVLAFSKMPVNTINHESVGAVVQAPNDAAYLVVMSGCVSCHGKKLAGLTSKAGPPPGPNLTTVTWTTDQFIHAMATGKRPDGTDIAPLMPWPSFSKMTNKELSTIWEYVLQQPDRELGDNS